MFYLITLLQMDRMELYNQVDDFLKEIELNKYILNWKLPSIAYKEACDLSNHFGELSDDEIFRKLEECKNLLRRTMWALLRANLLTDEQWSKRLDDYVDMDKSKLARIDQPKEENFD